MAQVTCNYFWTWGPRQGGVSSTFTLQIPPNILANSAQRGTAVILVKGKANLLCVFACCMLDMQESLLGGYQPKSKLYKQMTNEKSKAVSFSKKKGLKALFPTYLIIRTTKNARSISAWRSRTPLNDQIKWNVEQLLVVVTNQNTFKHPPKFCHPTKSISKSPWLFLRWFETTMGLKINLRFWCIVGDGLMARPSKSIKKQII